MEETPSYLSGKNPHPRDKQISFEEGPHIYTITPPPTPTPTPTPPTDYSKLTSVTTWVHTHFGHFDAKKVIAAMMRNQKKWNDPVANAKYYGKTPEEIEQMWADNAKDASTKGTNMHYKIECFYNTPPPAAAAAAPAAAPAPAPAPAAATTTEFKYFLEFNDKYVVNGNTATAAADTTDDNKTRQRLEPYRTEWMVFHEEAQLAGSIDMVYENIPSAPESQASESPTTYSIYDWKRCKEIVKTNRGGEYAKHPVIEHFPDTNYWHYTLQLNIYKYILQEKYGKTITDLYLVVLHPDAPNKSYQRIKLPDIQSEVSELFKDRIAKLKST